MDPAVAPDVVAARVVEEVANDLPQQLRIAPDRGRLAGLHLDLDVVPLRQDLLDDLPCELDDVDLVDGIDDPAAGEHEQRVDGLRGTEVSTFDDEARTRVRNRELGFVFPAARRR